MLGKGLESLIPPNQGKPASDNVQQPVVPHQNVPHVNAPAQQPHAEAVPSHQHNAQQHFQKPEELQRAGAQEEQKKNRRPESIGSVFHIEVEKIKPNPQQPRRRFDEDALKDLASSIREFGILQPIVVSKIEIETPQGTEVEYILIAGERRWLASKILGLERIPAIIRNVDLERERLELAIIENIQRENLNPIEKARAYARLQDEFRLTQREIASRLGKSRETVANAVRLLDLPAAIMEALERNQISESHGRLLLAIEDPGTQERIFRELLDKRMTTRDLKNKVRGAETVEEKTEVAPEIKMMQERLSTDLGAPVKIEARGEQGRITITFFSPEELRSIVDRIGKEDDLA